MIQKLAVGDPIQWGYGLTGTVAKVGKDDLSGWILVTPDGPFLKDRWIMAREAMKL